MQALRVTSSVDLCRYDVQQAITSDPKICQQITSDPKIYQQVTSDPKICQNKQPKMKWLYHILV